MSALGEDCSQSGPPEKRIKLELDVPTQVVVDASPQILCANVPSPAEPPVGGEQSPAGPASARYSNGCSSGSSANSSKENCGWRTGEDEEPQINAGCLLDMISKISNVFTTDTGYHGSLPRSPIAPAGVQSPVLPGAIPGALAVAQSPAAQLFSEGMTARVGACSPRAGTLSPAVKRSSSSAPHATSSLPGAAVIAQSPVAQLFPQDDWSWHRNPAAAIRSGGTNKQTPVWKYFVYNKAENLSRCIIADCTYQLKGPHTSTLACHLKKHPAEHAEFQKLKVEYSKDRNGAQHPPSPSSGASGSSGMSSVTSMHSTMKHEQPRPPKDKNAHKNIGSIVNALNRQAAASAAVAAQNLQNPGNTTLSPAAMVNNLLHAGINPAGFPFLFNPAAIPTSTASIQLANQILQQNGLNSANQAQLLKNKKWRRDERRQRELESRLALLLSVGHIDTDILTNQIFREFMEAAQPKFNIPEDSVMIEQLTSQMYSRCISSIKKQLQPVRRLSLMVDVMRVSSSTSPEDQTLRVCVGVAFLCVPSNRMETSLLAVRDVSHSEGRVAEVVRDTIQQVASEYEISLKKVSRVITNGVADLLTSSGQSGQKVADRQLEPVGLRVMHHLASLIDCSSSVEILRKAFYSMLFSIISRPQVMQNLAQINGSPVSFNLSDPFLVVAEEVLNFKHYINMVKVEQMDEAVMLSEEQWKVLETLCALFSQFKAHVDLLHNGELATIDGVAPALMQMIIMLDKDLPLLGELSDDLKRELKEQTAPILDVNSPLFDGTFLQATALNPQLAVLLDDEQITYAKSAIEELVQNRMRQSEEAKKKEEAQQRVPKSFLGVDSLLANVLDRKNIEESDSQNGFSPRPSSHSASLYPDLLQAEQQKQVHENKAQGKNRFAEAIVNAYFDEVLSTPNSDSSAFTPSTFSNRHLPPLAFWQCNAHGCAPLADLATELLTIPATTLSMERIFSVSGEAAPIPGSPFNSFPTTLNGERLERDLILRYNRNHVPKNL